MILANLVLAGLFVACPKEERQRDLSAVEPVKVVEEAPRVLNTDPLPGWKSGWTNAPEMKGQPDEHWSVTLDGPVLHPIAGDASQFFATADGRVYAFAADGKRQWELRLAATGAPTLSLETIVIGGYEGRVRWMDRATGKDRTVTPGGGTIQGAIVPIDGGFAWVTVDGVVSSTAGWEVATNLKPMARPASDESTVYFVTADGILAAVGPKGVEWQTNLPGTPVDGPVLDEDNVYVAFASSGQEPGGVVAIRRWGPPIGKLAWMFRTAFQPLAAPAVKDAVYLPDKDGTLYALSRDAGTVVWRNEAYGAFTTQPLIAGKSLYVGNADGNIYRIDAFDGGTAWTADLGAPVTGQPAISGNTMVVGLANGRLVGLKP